MDFREAHRLSKNEQSLDASQGPWLMQSQSYIALAEACDTPVQEDEFLLEKLQGDIARIGGTKQDLDRIRMSYANSWYKMQTRIATKCQEGYQLLLKRANDKPS